MKIILTLTTMFCLLFTSVYLVKLAAQGDAEEPPIHQNEEHIETCTQNLLAIGKAIQAYHKEHGKYPKWLSDLHPKYLTDEDLLVCPADVVGGNPRLGGNRFYFPDPARDGKIPGSYDYQFHPSYHRNESIIKIIKDRRAFYGDVVPLVRCWHHQTQEFGCINLDFAYRVYKSPVWWSAGLEMAYGGIEPAIAALEVGLKKMPNQEDFFHAYLNLVDLYIKAKKEKEADRIITRFKTVMEPNNIYHNMLLGFMLESRNRVEEMLELFDELLEHHKENRTIFQHLSRIHKKLGNDELALEYQKKADPLSSIRKIIPDFSAKDLDGKPISLEAYRGKVVLLDFWAVWCGPCIAEMPNIKKVYNTYKDKGFEVIGISLDIDEAKLRDFLKENDIPWRQVFDGQGRNSAIPQQYGIRSIPSMWLIDKDGKLISNNARGEKLENMVAEALKDKLADLIFRLKCISKSKEK